MERKRLRKKQRKKQKHRLRIVSYWLLIIGLLFLVGGGLKVRGVLKKAVWDGQGRINLIVVNKEVFLASFEPLEKKLIILKIPGETEIEVVGGFGQYQVGAIYRLGELEGRGGELLRESVQESLGVPVDGWIKISNFQFPISNTKASFTRVLAGLMIKKKGATNLTRWDFLRLWWETRKVLSHQVQIVQLDKLGVLRKKILADGSEVWEVDRKKLDLFFQDNFYEPKLREENLTVKVVNTTNYPGLAAHLSRIITNMGGRVIEIKNKQSLISGENEKLEIKNEKCEVRGERSRRGTYTVRRLLQVLDCQFVEEKQRGGRAEVTVLVGEGYWRMLNER